MQLRLNSYTGYYQLSSFSIHPIGLKKLMFKFLMLIQSWKNNGQRVNNTWLMVLMITSCFKFSRSIMTKASIPRKIINKNHTVGDQSSTNIWWAIHHQFPHTYHLMFAVGLCLLKSGIGNHSETNIIHELRVIMDANHDQPLVSYCFWLLT